MEDIAKELFKKHQVKSYIKPLHIEELIQDILGVFYPHFLKGDFANVEELENSLEKIRARLKNLFADLNVHENKKIDAIMQSFPKLVELLDLDAKSILSGDPAATCLDEVLLCYPGFLAIAIYRLAHEISNHKIPILPRMMTEYAHSKTGIDIHPEAHIGKHFFIDHGTGIVIGATAIIGDHVKIYHGVTLGALSVDKKMSDTKRHPTIEDHCIIYSNSTILGGETIIGHHSVVGGNTWITNTLLPYSQFGKRNQ